MASPSFPRPRISRSSPAAEKYCLEIVQAGGLNPLLRLFQSTDLGSVHAAVSCVRNLTRQPTDDSPIIEAGFLQPLVNLMAFKDSGEIQLDAASALRNLTASTEENKRAIVDAGAVQSIKELVMGMPVDIQIEMTTCIKALSCSGMRSSQLYSLISSSPR